MYIKLKNNNIVFRISREESNKLLNASVLKSKIYLPNNFYIVYEIHLCNSIIKDTEELRIEGCNDSDDSKYKIKLKVEKKSLINLMLHSSKNGILRYFYFNDNRVQCSFQIDIK